MTRSLEGLPNNSIQRTALRAAADAERYRTFMRTQTVLVLCIVVLAACSTSPVTEHSAEQVKKERIYEPSFVGPAVSDNDATVVFLRDKGFMGAGCSHDLYIDNVKVFAIDSNEQITIHVPSGQRFFRLETGGGLCPNIATSQETTLGPGARQVYRILLPSDGSLRLTRIE